MAIITDGLHHSESVASTMDGVSLRIPDLQSPGCPAPRDLHVVQLGWSKLEAFPTLESGSVVLDLNNENKIHTRESAAQSKQIEW